jgi:hypothetical protein
MSVLTIICLIVGFVVVGSLLSISLVRGAR